MSARERIQLRNIAIAGANEALKAAGVSPNRRLLALMDNFGACMTVVKRAIASGKAEWQPVAHATDTSIDKRADPRCLLPVREFTHKLLELRRGGTKYG